MAMWHVAAVRRFAKLISMRRLVAPAPPGRGRQALIRLIASKWESDCSQVAENSHQARTEAAAGAAWRAQRRVKPGKKLYAIAFNRWATIVSSVSSTSSDSDCDLFCCCCCWSWPASGLHLPGMQIQFILGEEPKKTATCVQKSRAWQVNRQHTQQQQQQQQKNQQQKRKNSTNDGWNSSRI